MSRPRVTHSPARCPRRASFPGRILSRAGLLATLLLVLGLLLAGCGETTTTPEVPPLHSELTGSEGRTVTWITDRTTLGTVRYGFVSGQYDRLAYPAAADGADKAFSRTHAVPLLGAQAGVPIYIQRTDLSEQGQLYAAAEETVTFAAPPVVALQLRFTSLDVQFGDAHVLQLPSEDKLVMIDAGNPYEGRGGESAPHHVRRWLQDHAVTRLDVALATHMHVDHYGGFLRGADDSGSLGLIDLYEIGLFLDVPAVSGNEYALADLRAEVDAKGIARLILEPGQTDVTDPAALAWDPLVHVVVLNAGAQPEWATTGFESDRLNNDSIALKISYGEVDLFSGGDCQVQAEARMLTRYPQYLVSIEYFKVFHHGRNDENSRTWIAAIRPRAAVIPVAFIAYNEGAQGGYDNTKDVLARLAAVDADVFRFDAAEPLGKPQDNQTFWHTTFVTDGTSYEVRIARSVWGP
jgi:beta-lactamase superfamily II metal-dependent hydrolase